MSKRKKQIRTAFRKSVFERDKHICKGCEQEFGEDELDAHHITDRNEMPNGGYVKENGITLCESCHLLAEEWHNSGKAFVRPEFHPDSLYKKIASSYRDAYRASQKFV